MSDHKDLYLVCGNKCLVPYSAYLTTVTGCLYAGLAGNTIDTPVVTTFVSGISCSLQNGFFGLTMTFLTDKPITKWTTDLLTVNQPLGISAVPMKFTNLSSGESFYCYAEVWNAVWDGEKMAMNFVCHSPTDGVDQQWRGSLTITWKNFSTWVSMNRVCVQKIG